MLGLADMLLYCIGEEADDVLTSMHISPENKKNYNPVVAKFNKLFKVRRNIIFEVQPLKPTRRGVRGAECNGTVQETARMETPLMSYFRTVDIKHAHCLTVFRPHP